VGAAHLELAF